MNTNMTLKEYQALAQRTAKTDGDEDKRRMIAGLGLGGELGEFLELIKKSIAHGHEIQAEEFANELGDVLWYLAESASAYGLDLGRIAAHNILKLQSRYPEGFSQEDSKNRNIDNEVFGMKRFVKIIKSTPPLWYRSKIGEVFEVIEEDSKHVWGVDNEGILSHVYRQDVELAHQRVKVCNACGKNHRVLFFQQNKIRKGYEEYYYEGLCEHTNRIWLLADNGGMVLLSAGEH